MRTAASQTGSSCSATRPASHIAATRRYMGVYLQGARDATVKFADLYAQTRDPRARADYEALRAQRGFRLLSNKVDSDAASPRACFQFSEPLARSGVDFAPYVAITGKGDFAVSGEDRQRGVKVRMPEACRPSSTSGRSLASAALAAFSIARIALPPPSRSTGIRP